jgi:subtilase family serine protease
MTKTGQMKVLELRSLAGALLAMVFAGALAACGGAAGGSSSIPGGGTVPTPTPTPTQTPGGGASPLIGPDTGPNGGWGPPAVATSLNFPVQSGFNGSGRTVAVIIDTYPALTDLDAFFAYFNSGRTGSYSTEAVDGGPGKDDELEAALDVEAVGGLAPGANVIVYGVPDLSTASLNDAVARIVADGKASVASYSASGCEYSGMGSTDSVLQSAANAGVAFVTAAGDEGNECYYSSNVYNVGVGFPASDPNAIGVGGTETSEPLHALTSDAAWNDHSCSGNAQCATGGGVSGYFALPPYQNGIGTEASSSRRNVPDVAMPAEDAAAYIGGAWKLVNGTSWSAPLYAALLAETYEYCNAAFKNPVQMSYYVAAHASSAFVDVTKGNNQFGTATPYYAARTGFDNVSGWGVPYGMAFAQTLCPNRVPAALAQAAAATIDLASARTAGSIAAPQVEMPAAAGLTDAGPRNEAQTTRIQIAVASTAAPAADEAAIVSALQSAGFTIVQTFPSHLVVDAEAPASRVEQFFRTKIHDVIQMGYGRRYAPVTPATVPASVAPYAGGVVLDDVVTAFTPR